MAAPSALTARQGETLDALLWRELRLGANDLGPIYAANPGLASFGPILPLGTKVIVPANTTPAATSLPLIQLWD